jgi:hypothetical protein
MTAFDLASFFTHVPNLKRLDVTMSYIMFDTNAIADVPSNAQMRFLAQVNFKGVWCDGGNVLREVLLRCPNLEVFHMYSRSFGRMPGHAAAHTEAMDAEWRLWEDDAEVFMADELPPDEVRRRRRILAEMERRHRDMHGREQRRQDQLEWLQVRERERERRHQGQQGQQQGQSSLSAGSSRYNLGPVTTLTRTVHLPRDGRQPVSTKQVIKSIVEIYCTISFLSAGSGLAIDARCNRSR